MRIQVDVSDQKARQIKDLMTAADFKTYADLFNNAVTLVRWTVREVQNGALIVAFDERKNNMKELSMPFLEHVAEESRPASKTDGEDDVEVEDLNDLSAKLTLQDQEIARLRHRVDIYASRAESAEAMLRERSDAGGESLKTLRAGSGSTYDV